MATEVNQETLVNAKTIVGTSTGPIPVVPSPQVDGVTTTVVRQPVNTSNAIFKEADPNRVGLTIYNQSPAGANLFIKLGTTASLTGGSESFTRRLGPQEYWEVPFGYTGRVDALWDAADANGEALIVEQFGGFSPLSLSGYQIWLRGDQGLLSGTTMPYWADSAGLRVPALQAVVGNQPTQVASIINGKPVVRFGPAGHFMTWSPVWSQPTIVSIYGVVQFTPSATFQLVFLGGTANSYYLGGDTEAGPGLGFDNRPSIYSGTAMRGIWPTVLTNGTNYLVKWISDRTVAAASRFATQVNDGTESSEVATGTTVDNFVGLGLASQDLLSDVAELVAYNRVLTAGEQQQLWDYFNTKYAIF